MAKTTKNFIEPEPEDLRTERERFADEDAEQAREQIAAELSATLNTILAERTPADLDLPESLPDGTGGALEQAVADLSLSSRITAETNGALTWRILTQTYVAAAYAATTPAELVVALEDLSLVVSVWFGDVQTRALEALDAETEGRE